jgi:transketolase
MTSSFSFHDLASCVRFLAVDAVEAAASGHPGMPLGMADVVTTLFARHLVFSPSYPQWPNRDRFVLSAGHGSMLLYALSYVTGYEAMTLENLKNFRQWGSHTPGHPEKDILRGIETTTGPLGQGLGNAVGMALGGKILQDRYGSHYNYRTYCVVGDGCLMEGLSQEAISFAGHYQLNNLTVLFDDNGISIDGPTSLSTSEDHLKRFEACAWQVKAVDGHDVDALDQALRWAKTCSSPTLIACKTRIGYGAPQKEGTSKAHGSPLGSEEVKALRHALKWPYEPFHIPEPLLKAWRDIGLTHKKEAELWLERHGHQMPRENNLDQALAEFKNQVREGLPKQATRGASGDLIEKLMASSQLLIGGSADLTPSNLTKSAHAPVIAKETYKGSYVHYGIREHLMGAAMNGLALTGFRPFGGTFLVFSDYMRPAVRLAALMKLPVIYVLTHDSIGLGEDGPTHQPIEHLASLRAIPNLQVLRPMDALETIECWQLALENTTTPTVLALSRQNLPCFARDTSENLSARGGYIVAGDSKESHLSLCATGSEVALAYEVHGALKARGIASHVVSLPWIEGFLGQDKVYQEHCIPSSLPVFAMEAACSLGWDRIIQQRGRFFGLDHFGASAACEKLYEAFGLTAVKIADKISHYLQNPGGNRSW